MYSPQYFTTYSPRVRVLVKDAETAETHFDFSPELVSLATNKAYGRCSGTWQLMLPYITKQFQGIDGSSTNFFNAVIPNMMLTIEMDAGNGAGYFPVMCGLIDRVSEVRNDGALPSRSIKISGRDMGKLLETHDVALDIVTYNRQIATQKQHQTQKAPALSRWWDPTTTKGTPGELIKKAVDITMKNLLTTTGRIWFVDTAQDTWQQSQPNYSNVQGCPLWQFIKQMEHSPYTILTTDTGRADIGNFYIFHEKIPYSNTTGHLEREASRWHTIGDPEIATCDLGVGDQERVNLLSYQPNIYVMAKVFSYDVMMAHPELTHWDEADIKRNGLCARVLRDNFTPPEMKGQNDSDPKRTSDAIVQAKELSLALWNWYRNNHTYESGTLTVHLRPDIRVGDGILIKQPDNRFKEYFVEQVSHQCTFHPQPQFMTTMHLSRGQKTTPKTAELAGPPKPATTE